MICNNCGTNLPLESGFCHKCGNMIPKGHQVNNKQIILCLPMCILRFIDAFVWSYITIVQISYGYAFLDIAWNIVGTGLMYILAVSLLNISLSKTTDIVIIENIITRNMSISGIGIVWYIVQLLFFYGGGILIFAIMIEIAILIIGLIIMSIDNRNSNQYKK